MTTAGRVLLLSMPLSVPHYPNLALGLLKAALTRDGHHCDVRYFSLDYVDYIGADDHACLTNVAYYMAHVGEWLFAEVAHGRPPTPGLDFLLNSFRRDHPGFFEPGRIRTFLTAREGAPAFIERCSAAVDWASYDIVGFSTSFQQTMASLALARRVKQKFPQVLTVFGGINCQDEMGRELHRRYECIDVLSLGESDRTFPELVDRHLTGQSLLGIPGLAVREGGVSIQSEISNDAITDLDALPYPDYDDFFLQHAQSPEGSLHAPTVTFETARGCWWGEKHHCPFCGLNGVTIAFRAKSQARAYDELEHIVTRYNCRDVANADKILDMRYFEEFLPRLAESGLDLTMYYEAKVNLNPDQMTLLARAGLKKVQFGIENFDTELLRLVAKGSTMLQNVEVLKLSAENGIYVEWLAISGVPRENPELYQRLAAVLPKLRHLQAPAAFLRVRADRFSPYSRWPERYGVRLTPLSAYSYIFPFDDASLRKLALHFVISSDALDRHDEYAADAKREYAAWCAHQGESELYYDDIDDDTLIVHDTRWGRCQSTAELTGAAAAVFRLCWQITRWHDVVTAFAGRYTEADLAAAATDLAARDLMMREGSRWITLALRQPGYRAAPSWEQVRRGEIVPHALAVRSCREGETPNSQVCRAVS